MSVCTIWLAIKNALINSPPCNSVYEMFQPLFEATIHRTYLSGISGSVQKDFYACSKTGSRKTLACPTPLCPLIILPAPCSMDYWIHKLKAGVGMQWACKVLQLPYMGVHACRKPHGKPLLLLLRAA